MKFLWILFGALLFTGCQTKQQPQSVIQEREKPLPAHKAPEDAQATAKANSLDGTVLERIDADRYSYLRLSTSAGEIWAAVLQTEVKAGESVSVVNPMPMNGFESKTLKRKFDKLVFGALSQSAEMQNEMQALSKAHAGISSAANIGSIKLQKAAGAEGRTVAEVFAQKFQLKDRKVTVRGKVVKVNTGIMGKTWIHLRDGTGDSKTQTDDLTVTSQESVTIGDTVLVNGIVRTDRNLGMGYVFPVIIEDATIAKQ